MFQGSTRLKYFKRLKIYKNSTNTVSFDPQTKVGYSYNWQFVGLIKGVLIFNDYNWSPTTSGHQSAVSSVLRELGLTVIRGDFGRRDVSAIGRESVCEMYRQLCDLDIEIESATRKDTSAQQWRISGRNDIAENIEKLKPLGFVLTKKEMKLIRQTAEDAALDEYTENCSEKVFKALSLKRAETNVEEVAI